MRLNFKVIETVKYKAELNLTCTAFREMICRICLALVNRTTFFVCFYIKVHWALDRYAYHDQSKRNGTNKKINIQKIFEPGAILREK